jgi:hypothetical protein
MNPIHGTPRVSPPTAVDNGLRAKSIDELMAEQGITGPQDLDALAAPDLWDDDAEFERFLAWLRESRRERR